MENKNILSFLKWVLFFLIFIIGIELILYFHLSPHRFFSSLPSLKKKPPITPPVEVSFPTPLEISPAKKEGEKEFCPPVEKNFLKKAQITQMEYGVNDLGFFLPKGTFVFAISDGVVNLAGGKDDPQKLLLILNPQGITWKYFYHGQPLVNHGERVKKGEKIIEIEKGTLPTRQYNLIVQASKGQKRINLKKEIFE